jgi:hypothetical protein
MSFVATAAAGEGGKEMTGAHERALRAVLRVDGGRGFVVKSKHHNRLVITAGHCLPCLPPCDGGSFLEERTYERLVGPLDAEPTVSAECLFVDPVSDLAVLGPPDSQARWAECEQYEKFMEAMTPLRIAKAVDDASAFLLSLDLRWLPCRAHHVGGPVWITGTKGVGGMSGSPIINEAGRAIGVVSTVHETPGTPHVPSHDTPHVRLMRSLPRWMDVIR